MTLALLLWLAVWGTSAPQTPGPAIANTVSVPAPKPSDTCPVCGMFVAKYPHWIATVVWKDGTVAHFDGAKDLFTYVLQLPKYAPGRSTGDMGTIAVTEFYDLRRIDARQAYYVVGSDVLGPMGREFVPFASQADADEFSRDHHGVRILRFKDITLLVVQQVDAGRH